MTSYDDILKKGENNFQGDANQRNQAPFDLESVKRLVSEAEIIKRYFEYDDLLLSAHNVTISPGEFCIRYKVRFPRKHEEFNVHTVIIEIRHFELKDLAMKKLGCMVMNWHLGARNVGLPTSKPLGQCSLNMGRYIMWVHNTHYIDVHSNDGRIFPEIDEALINIAEVIEKHLLHHTIPSHELQYPSAALNPMNTILVTVHDKFQVKLFSKSAKDIHPKMETMISDEDQNIARRVDSFTFFALKPGTVKVSLVVGHSRFLTVQVIPVEVHVAEKLSDRVGNDMPKNLKEQNIEDPKALDGSERFASIRVYRE